MSQLSDLHRRDFLSTATTGLALASVGARPASASTPAETVSAISAQPMPAFSDDETTADILVDTLIAWGATHAFGIVGDGINSIIEALRKRQGKIRYIGVRHEEVAAFMGVGICQTHRAAWCLRRIRRCGRRRRCRRKIEIGRRLGTVDVLKHSFTGPFFSPRVPQAVPDRIFGVSCVGAQADSQGGPTWQSIPITASPKTTRLRNSLPMRSVHEPHIDRTQKSPQAMRRLAIPS